MSERRRALTTFLRNLRQGLQDLEHTYEANVASVANKASEMYKIEYAQLEKPTGADTLPELADTATLTLRWVGKLKEYESKASVQVSQAVSD